MVRYALVAGLALVLAACAAPVADPNAASSWTIGPRFLDGTNASVGAPLHPAAEAGGFGFDIPRATFPPAAHVHYVTRPAGGALNPAATIRLHVRITAPDGVRLLARTAEGAPALLTPYFQRCGDDWSALGNFETFRWYASFATVVGLGAGEYEVDAALAGPWTAVQSSTRATAPQAFADALAHACEVGFVLGGGDGLGHGIYADGGTAHLTVTHFSID